MAKQLGGSPAVQTFAAIANAQDVDSEKAVEVYLKGEYGRRHAMSRSSGQYQLSWDSWEESLQYLCRASGYDMSIQVHDMVNEFREKAMVANPSLTFHASWQPLYIARFGKLPAKLIEVDGGSSS